MLVIPIVFYVIAFVMIVYGFYGYNNQKKGPDPAYYIFGGMFVAICGIIAGFIFKHEIRSFYESYQNLENSLGRLGAVLPTLAKQCLENPAKESVKGAAGKYIQDLITQIATQQAALKTAYVQLVGTTPSTASAAWNNATGGEQSKITSSFNNIMAICDKYVLVKPITVNGKNIQSWAGTYTCDDICSAWDEASYSYGGNCTCPEGNYPQLDSTGFVRCAMLDKSMLSNVSTMIENLTTSMTTNLNVPPAISALTFYCGTGKCLQEAPIKGETTGTSAPTPGPTTSRPTTSPTTQPAAPTPGPTTSRPTTSPTTSPTTQPAAPIIAPTTQPAAPVIAPTTQPAVATRIFQGVVAQGSAGTDPFTTIVTDLSTVPSTGIYTFTYSKPATISSGFLRFWLRSGTSNTVLPAFNVASDFIASFNGQVTIPVYARNASYQLVVNAEPNISPLTLQVFRP